MKKIPDLGFGGRGLLSFKFLKIFLVIASATSIQAASRRYELPLPVAPTAEALREIADAMGAATFEELSDDAKNLNRPKPGEIVTGTFADVEYQTYQGVVGRPGVDFPVLPAIPQTFFDCKAVATGYYADLETDCQVFHICDGGRKISFLCPNGTIFRQSNLICDWWFKVDCSDSPGQYEESAEHLAEDQRKAAKNSISSQKSFETIHTTQRRPPSNFGSEIITGHNHISDYKAEASFNSVAQSGVPAPDVFKAQETKSPVKPNPRSFQAPVHQERVTNSRQYSGFEQSTRSSKELNTFRDDVNQRKTTVNNKISPTRRTALEYTNAAVYRSSTQPPKNHKDIKETQVLAESASFVNNRGRNNYNHFTSNQDGKYRPISDTIQSDTTLSNARTTKPSYTTTYIPGSKNYVEVTRSVSHSVGSTVRSKPIFSNYFSVSTTSKPPSTQSKNSDTSQSYSQTYQSASSLNPNINFKISSSNYRNAKGFQLPSNNNYQNADESTTNNYWKSYENVTFYAPTVPTVTPKAYNSSTNKFLATNWYSTVENDALPSSTVPSYNVYSTEPTVSEHAVDMIKTLEKLEYGTAESTTETEHFLGKRTGLFVPPSAGPNTLHSLAIYFATAVDNFVSTDIPTTVTEETRQEYNNDEHLEDYDDSYSSVLSQRTINKYSDLFKNSSHPENTEVNESDEIEHNDLEPSQSRGPLSSSPQIRELAQVFTHALSAYLQDPETFRKVLSEIRPTDPTNDVPKLTTVSPFEEISSTNDYSIVKDEDEVLDFSDVSKSSARPTSTELPSLTTGQPTKAYNVDLIKDRLLLTTSPYRHQTPIYYSDTKNKTPASQIITNHKNENQNIQNDIRQGKVLSTTLAPSTNNAVAVEVNGGLGINERIPSSQNSQQTHSNCTSSNTFTRDSYFPQDFDRKVETVPRYGGFQNNTNNDYSPYGIGVQPLNSTPINGVYSGSLSSTGIPVSWGDLISSKISNSEISRIPYLDLVPPTSYSDQSSALDSDKITELNNYYGQKDSTDLEIRDQIVSTDYQTTETPQLGSTISSDNQDRATFKYRSHSADRGMYYNNYKTSNENEEQLQRAHSQSFVSSANQINRRGKKIENSNKSNKNNNDSSDKPTVTSDITLRVSNDVNAALPTLKDILSKPTSTIPLAKNTSEINTTIELNEPTTTFTIQDTTSGSTKYEDSTPQYESTTVVYTHPSTNPQSTITQQDNLWSTSAALGQIWQTTVFLDPITINDGLSSDIAHETIFPSANTYINPYNRDGKYFSATPSESTTTVVTDQADTFKYSTFSTPLDVAGETNQFSEELTTKYPETPTYEIFPPTLSSSLETQNTVQTTKSVGLDSITVSAQTREGKSLSTSAPNILQHLNPLEVDQTMMNKAKEMFGGLNESSANTLMNVMKKADKNTNVRRLILLLVQTCDDDHNKTLEASRTALLDALMRIPSETETTSTQNPYKSDFEIVRTEEITSTKSPPTNFSNRRIDEIFDTQDTKYPEVSVRAKGRTGKRIELDSIYPNSVQENIKITYPSSPVTELPTSTTTKFIINLLNDSFVSDLNESSPTEAPVSKTTDSSTKFTPIAPVVTVKMSRRGQRKFYTKTTKTPIYSKQGDDEKSISLAERGSLSSVEDQSVPSDTRALELLRSLYSLAARWG